MIDRLIDFIHANGFDHYSDGDGERPYSDRPVVMLRHSYTAEELGAPNHCEIRVMCANLCVPNDDHHCGVPMPAGALRTDEWVQRTCEHDAWMILQWGTHGHRLPFCCVQCLLEFTIARTEHHAH